MWAQLMVTKLTEDIPSGHYWLRQDSISRLPPFDIRKGYPEVVKITEPQLWRRKLQRMVYARHWSGPLSQVAAQGTPLVEGPIPEPTFDGHA